MLWQPDVESAPLVVRLPGCADLCPLDHWVSLTSDVTIDMDTWTRHSSHITQILLKFLDKAKAEEI